MAFPIWIIVAPHISQKLQNGHVFYMKGISILIDILCALELHH